MVKIVRITGSGFVKTGAITSGHPVEFRHWKEVVAEADFELESAAHQETEEAAIEQWLENPQDFVDSEVKTASIRRVDNFSRTRTAAPQQNWDADFADAQAHVAGILGKLGNGGR
jgi:MarR-like DNA-binding transcriptional regulator SgrR of sgrS sRNA